jgi:hypothetical protein
VAYWLLQNGITVMIAACDTFRSGAVEQLKTHCARLQVRLVCERGCHSLAAARGTCICCWRLWAPASGCSRLLLLLLLGSGQLPLWPLCFSFTSA